MSRFSWLLFDLDNTLLDFGASSKAAFRKIFSDLGYAFVDKDYDAYRKLNHTVWVELEKGLIGFEELKAKRWRLFFDAYKLDHDPMEINHLYFEHIGNNPVFIDGAQELVDSLQNKFRLCLITNGLSVVQKPRLRISGLEDKFEHIVISEEIGVSKPDSAFFDYCMNLMGLPMKEDLLVIGDTLTSDIRGGIDYGIQTCWYNYYKEENKTQYRPDHEITALTQLHEVLNQDY